MVLMMSRIQKLIKRNRNQNGEKCLEATTPKGAPMVAPIITGKLIELILPNILGSSIFKLPQINRNRELAVAIQKTTPSEIETTFRILILNRLFKTGTIANAPPRPDSADIAPVNKPKTTKDGALILCGRLNCFLLT